uniref:Uncharacterized protein n=1 Tax=Aegilops tauschii subsp. strangulata TaxID=200361 RepID=A0A453I6K9_AEGTS
ARRRAPEQRREGGGGAGALAVDAQAGADTHPRVHLQQRHGQPAQGRDRPHPQAARALRRRRRRQRLLLVPEPSFPLTPPPAPDAGRCRSSSSLLGCRRKYQYEQQATSSSSSGSTGGSSLGLFAAHGAGVSGAGVGYLQASCGTSSPLASGLMPDVDSGGSDDLFAISRQMGFVGSPAGSSSAAPNTAVQQQYYSCQLPAATITVFINGVPMEVPRGPIDLRAMFGQDVVLLHSTGTLLPVNDYGILIQSLQMGESYFLVSRSM